MTAYGDKTPAQIVADINDALVSLSPYKVGEIEDTIIMPPETWRYLWFRDKPNLKLLHSAGWKSGFTVNGFEP